MFMPAHIRRELLTAAQRAELLALPTDRLEISERYSLTPADFNLIDRHRHRGQSAWVCGPALPAALPGASMVAGRAAPIGDASIYCRTDRR